MWIIFDSALIWKHENAGRDAASLLLRSQNIQFGRFERPWTRRRWCTNGCRRFGIFGTIFRNRFRFTDVWPNFKLVSSLSIRMDQTIRNQLIFFKRLLLNPIFHYLFRFKGFKLTTKVNLFLWPIRIRWKALTRLPWVLHMALESKFLLWNEKVFFSFLRIPF